MKLSSLLQEIEYSVVSGSTDVDITGVSRDNRKAEPGDLFICQTGEFFDSHDEKVLKELSEKGVKAFLVEKDVTSPEGVCIVWVDRVRLVASSVCAAFYGHPARKMVMIGVTGSKGKTTSTHMLRSVLMAAGIQTGLMGTNGVDFCDRHYDLTNTTPEFDEVQYYLNEMALAGCKAAVMEVSSAGMMNHRLDGVTFDYGIFLNLQEGDHIGPREHPDFNDYARCKAELLNHSKRAILYGEDAFLTLFMSYVKLPKEAILTFGEKETDDYQAVFSENQFDEARRLPGIRFDYTVKTQIHSCFTNFPGSFNVLNALSVIAVADCMGLPEEAVKAGLSDVKIRGRNDIVYDGKFRVIVDFAHNGASAWGHLSALKEFRAKRIVCVFGADGNRSIGRRLGMGEAAGTLADFSIVTSGHNRFETFEAILADIETGLRKAPDPHYIAIKDREEAIRYAIKNAEEGDLITILGLGHENWQEENGKKRRYSDIEFVKQVVKEMNL